MQTLCAQGIAQGLNNMRLPDHFRKILGAVFASEDEIGHRSILKCPKNHPADEQVGLCARGKSITIQLDGPPRMVKRPTGSDGEPSSPNCGASAGVGLVTFFLRSEYSCGFPEGEPKKKALL